MMPPIGPSRPSGPKPRMVALRETVDIDPRRHRIARCFTLSRHRRRRKLLPCNRGAFRPIPSVAIPCCNWLPVSDRRRNLSLGGGNETARLPSVCHRRNATCSGHIKGSRAGPHLSPRLLVCSQRRNSAVFDAFFETLRRHGFVEGQNLLDDPDGYGLRADQFAEHAAKIVKNHVDVIVCTGNAAIHAAQQATTTIPILGSTDDMVGSGLVHSMAKPEGNTTGNSILSTELNGKRLEVLLEVLPAVRQMAALADANTYSPQYLQMLREWRVRAASNFPSTGYPRLRRLRMHLTRRRVQVLEPSTCWRHRFCTLIVGLSAKRAANTVTASYVPSPRSGRGRWLHRIRP